MPRSTKLAILHTMIELLKERTLDEITVKDLTERCGISRQAFYYHFSDIYDVVSWALQQKFEELDDQKGDWQNRLIQLGEQLREKRTIVLNAYHAYERSYVEHYLKGLIRPLITEEVNKTAQKYDVTEDQMDFIIELFTMLLISILLNWLDHGMTGGIEEFLDDFFTITNGTFDDALARLTQKNRRAGNLTKE